MNFPDMGSWRPAEIQDLRRQESNWGQDGVGSKALQELSLLDFVEIRLMVQRVTVNTRYDKHIDLVWSNNNNIYRNVQVDINLKFSDHNSIFIKVEVLEMTEESEEEYIFLTPIKNYHYESIDEGFFKYYDELIVLNKGGHCVAAGEIAQKIIEWNNAIFNWINIKKLQKSHNFIFDFLHF